MTLPTHVLGRGRLQITQLGFGSWAVGGGGWAFGWGPQDDAQSLATMRRPTGLYYAHGSSAAPREMRGRYCRRAAGVPRGTDDSLGSVCGSGPGRHRRLVPLLILGPHFFIYAFAVVVAMITCSVLNVASASRLAGVTTTIIFLVPHVGSPVRMFFTRVAEVGWGVVGGGFRSCGWRCGCPRDGGCTADV
jgi:hypothetical protein